MSRTCCAKGLPPIDINKDSAYGDESFGASSPSFLTKLTEAAKRNSEMRPAPPHRSGSRIT